MYFQPISVIRPDPYYVIGYLDATTAPIRHRGVVAFAARRAKELGADAIIVLSHGIDRNQFFGPFGLR